MKKWLILFGFICHVCAAQERVDVLLDSLTRAGTNVEKSEISVKIATELRFTDWGRASYYLEYAEDLVKKSGSKQDIAEFYLDAAIIYENKEALDVALDYFLKSYEVYKHKDSYEKNLLENNIAILYARLRNREKALPLLRTTYQYALQRNDSISAAYILNNIGTLYMDEKEMDSAVLYYNNALQIMNEFPEENDAKAYLYSNIGRCYLENRLDLAGENFQKAIRYTEIGVNDEYAARAYSSASLFYYRINEPDSAVYYAEKAMFRLQEREKYDSNNEEAVQNLYKAYLLKEDYKNAAQYFELYNEIKDSINIQDKVVKAERLKVEYEYKARDEIRALKESRQKSRMYIIGLSLLILLLILVIFLFRFRNRLVKSRLENSLIQSKKNELDAKLELKNKELTSKAMAEINRTEIVGDILNDLKAVKLKATKETQQTVDYILKRLEKDIQGNIWKEFEVAFEQVHESFYQKLNEKHPDLTSRDKRLCAMLKLNLTSKEIAQLTGQSFKSVENSRTRLRKKLQITNTKTDIGAYLSSF